MPRRGFASRTLAGMLAALLASGCGGGSAQGDASGPTSRYLEVGVFLDNAFFRVHGARSETEAQAIMNVVSSHFDRAGAGAANRVVLLVVGVHTFIGDKDPWTIPATGNGEVAPGGLLQEFSTYVGKNHPFAFDAAILISGLEFPDGSLGASDWGKACSPTSAYAVARVLEGNIPFTAAIVARQLGQTLGMCLDPPGIRGPECPDVSAVPGGPASCTHGLMSEVIRPSAPPEGFSACSASDLDAFFARASAGGTCLAPP